MTNEAQNSLLSYLNPEQPFEFMASIRYSTLIAGLRDCRVYTKRDVTTGRHNSEIKFGDEGNWLGAIGYFTVLDQMGSCFKPLDEPEPPTNAGSIKFAIEKFGYDIINNDPKQLNALIALRNAFTHDFNLLNIPRDQKLIPLQQHKFTVTADLENKWLVKLPSSQWNGDIENKDFYDTSDSTFINLFELGNLVEEIFLRITKLILSGQIELRVSLLTLINKYTFITSNHPIK